jgi:O-antigen ligase
MMAVEATSVDLRGSVPRSALALAAVTLFFTNIDSYAFAAYGTPAPVQWVAVFALAAVALFIGNAQRPMHLLRSPIMAWVLFYFLLTTTWALWKPGLPAVDQEIFDRYRSIITLVTFLLVFDDPRAWRVAVAAIAVGVVVASILNVAETASLITFADTLGQDRTDGRAAGLYINPNTSGQAIALGLVIATEQVPKRWRTPLVLLAAFGVAATFSRGALVCLLVAVLWLLWRRALGTWWTVLASIVAFLLFVYAVTYVQSHDLLNEDTASRLQFTKDDSGRFALVAHAWDMFLSSPILGKGIGSTIAWAEPVRAHNMVATLAAEHGVLGLLAFPLLAAALARTRRANLGFALVLMAAGFFSHALLVDRYALLLTALAGAGPTGAGERRGAASGLGTGFEEASPD